MGTMGFREDIGSGNTKLWAVSMHATAPAVMVHFTEEDAVVEEIDGSGVELSSAAKAMYRVLE